MVVGISTLPDWSKQEWVIGMTATVTKCFGNITSLVAITANENGIQAKIVELLESN